MPNTLTPWLSRRGGHGRVATNSYLALLPFPLLSEPSSCQFSEPRGRMRENYWPGGVARAHHDRPRAGPRGRLHHPRVSGDSAVCGWSIFGGRGSVIPWPARARRRRLPRGLLWPVGEHAPLHARANGSHQCGGGFSNPLSPFRQRTRPEPNTGSHFQGHLRVPGPAGETGLGSPSPTHHVTRCHVRAINLPRPPAFFAGRLTIARPRAVFLQNLHDVSLSLSFPFLSRACK